MRLKIFCKILIVCLFLNFLNNNLFANFFTHFKNKTVDKNDSSILSANIKTQNKKSKNLKAQQQSEHKKYKIGIFIKNKEYSYTREMALKYFKYDKNLEIVEPEFVDVLFKDENYFTKNIFSEDMSLQELKNAKNDLDLHIIASLSVTEKSKEPVINMEYFDIYTKQIFYKNDRKIYSNRYLEYQIRNMIFEFLEANKNFIKAGATEKEMTRQKKIDELLPIKEAFELKKKFKIDSQKKFNDARKNRILKFKKELKLQKYAKFEQNRKTRILDMKKFFKIEKIKKFEEIRQARIKAKTLNADKLEIIVNSKNLITSHPSL